MRRMLVIAPILIGAFFIWAGSALAWTHLGGDPLLPGGIHSPSEAHMLVNTTRGVKAMRNAGLNSQEITATKGARFYKCSMRYGQWFLAMTYHFDGSKFEGPVQFKDRRYIGHPAPAECAIVQIRNSSGQVIRVLKIMIPDLCANFGLISRKRVTHRVVHRPLPGQRPVHKPAPRPAPQPAPQGNCNVNVTNSTNVTVVNCSTVVVWVQCGIIQIPFQRNTVEESVNAANQYYAAHVECSPPSPPVAVPPGTTPQPPPPCNNCGGHQPPPPCNDTSCQPCSGSSCQPCPNGTDQNGNCKKANGGPDSPPSNPGPGTTPPGGNPGPKGDPPPAGCNPQTDPNHCTGVDPTP
jgi:hypothetical protein